MITDNLGDHSILRFNDENFLSVCFNTSILDNLCYLTINETQIIFIPTKDYCDVKNECLKYAYSYDFCKNIWSINSSINFKNIIVSRVSTFDEIKVLKRHALLHNFPIKYNNDYYFCNSIDINLKNDTVSCTKLQTLKEKNIDLHLKNAELVYDENEINNARMLYSMYCYMNNEAYHLEYLPQCRKYYDITYKTKVGERTVCIFTSYDDVIIKKHDMYFLNCTQYIAATPLVIPLQDIKYIVESKISKEIYKRSQSNTMINYEIGDIITYDDNGKEYYCIFKGWESINHDKMYVYGLMHNGASFFKTYIIDTKNTENTLSTKCSDVNDYKMLCAIKLKCNGMKYNESDLPEKNEYYQIKFISDNGTIKYGIIHTENNYIIDNNIVFFFVGDSTPHLVNYNALISIKYYINKIENIKTNTNGTIEFNFEKNYIAKPVDKRKLYKKTEDYILKADFSDKVKQSVKDKKEKNKCNLIPYSYFVYKSNEKEDYWKLGQFAYEDEEFIYFTGGGCINKKFYIIMPIEKYFNNKKIYF